MNCSMCGNNVPKGRSEMGYTICVDCSTEEKVSCHTIYPHKTGAWVQPVSEEQSKNLNRLDRRGAAGTRKAKGIVADQSWDRWLEKYYNPKPDKPKFKPKPVETVYIPYKEAIKKVFKAFDSRGYRYASNLTQSLYSDDKISLVQKSKIVNELAFFETLTSKQKKYFKKMKKRS